jgi:hypothetical protein
MAEPQYGQLVATTFEKVINRKPIDQVFDEHWIFNHFTKGNGGRMDLDGGRRIDVTLDYLVNPSFRAVNDMEQLDTTRVDTVDAASYEWREHAGSIVWSDRELFMCSGESAKIDLLANKINNAINSHKEDISLALVAATSGKNVNGLQTLVADSPGSGSPGGINRGTFGWWRNFQVSGAATSTPFDNLRARYRTTYNATSKGHGGNHPKVIVSGLAPFAGYESLLVVNERFTSKNEGDGGFKNGALKYKGATMGYDERIADTRTYFLNPDGIKLVVGKGHFMKQGKEIESINSNARVKKFHSYLQFILTEPRLLGVVTAIS